MLSTAHMKLQIAKQSFTKSSERSSFGQRPSKSSRQVPQVYTPGNSSNQVSKACLPSKSSKQVLGWKTCLEDLLGRLAWCDWQTFLVCLEDLLGSFSSKSVNQALGVPRGRPSEEPGGCPSERHLYIYVYIYIYCIALAKGTTISRRTTPSCSHGHPKDAATVTVDTEWRAGISSR